jgi:hypothetical protein
MVCKFAFSGKVVNKIFYPKKKLWRGWESKQKNPSVKLEGFQISGFIRFIRLRQNTHELAPWMSGKLNGTIIHQTQSGLASAELRFDSPQLAAGSFIEPLH